MSMTAVKFVAVVGAVVLVLSSCSENHTALDSETSTPKLVLDCGASQPLGTDLDIPGPGRATPEKAVAPYAEGLDLVAEQSGRAAVVFGLTDGEVVRQFQARKHDDGWWPDGYTECTRRPVIASSTD